MVADDSGTFWASRRRVEPISLSPAHKMASPSNSWSEVTYAARGCQGRPKSGPPSARRRFDRCSLIEGPDNRDPCIEAEKRSCKGETTEAESPPPPPFHLPLIKRRGHSRDPCQVFPRHTTGGVCVSLSLSASSHVHAATLEARLASCPEASMGRMASRNSPQPSPRPCMKSQA
jgi:hypothetical protein